MDKSLSGIKNGLFPLARTSRPQYISHFKLAHAWAETGLASVSGGLAVRAAVWLSLLMASDQSRVDWALYPPSDRLCQDVFHSEAENAGASSSAKNTDASSVPLLPSFPLYCPAFCYCKHRENLQWDSRSGLTYSRWWPRVQGEAAKRSGAFWEAGLDALICTIQKSDLHWCLHYSPKLRDS